MNNKFKKMFSLSASLILTVSLIGCGSKTANGGKGDTKKTDFPTKAIEITVPYSAGGGTDSVARALADSAKGSFPQPVVVVNKTGGGGAVGMTAGANSKADGYAVTLATVELVTLPHLGLAAFTYNDFKPVIQINSDPGCIAVQADSKWKTLDEFMKEAKANPGKIKVGNSGVGAIWHLAAESLGKAAGVKFNNVPYEGAAPAIAALLGGHIEAVVASPAEFYSQVKAGKLRVLGVMSEKRVDSMPDVKTMKEQGYDVEIGTWRGIAVPKDTPDEVVKILEDGFRKAANTQTFKDFMKKSNLGLEVLDSKQFEEKITKENDSFKKLIGELGLKK